ncbi:hypothetical protein Dcar01_02550 [Deinococcus carri]|uniref:Uncharacterized protein n=1 Tax=Deinococcus carri TaxID=1211323 RepID=A0ABP9WC54_9DEIO
MKEDTRAARAELPQVAHVLSGEGNGFTLELESGQLVTIAEGDRAALLPIGHDNLAILTHQWGGPDRAAYAVPAALYLELLRHFPEGRPTGMDTLPTLTGAERLTDSLTLYAEGYSPLTLPRRGCWLHPAGFDPAAPFQGILALDVYPPGDYANGCYRFRVDTSTREGRAALAALGLSRFALGNPSQQD